MSTPRRMTTANQAGTWESLRRRVRLATSSRFAGAWMVRDLDSTGWHWRPCARA